MSSHHAQSDLSGDLWRPWLETHTCSICKTKFCRQADLKRHQESLHTKKIRKCSICKEQFTRKDNLTRHMKHKHGGVRKPRCRYCEKPLSRKDSASRHQKTCHRNPARQVDHHSPPSSHHQNRPNVIVRIGRREGSVNSECSDDSSTSSFYSH